MPSPHLLAVPNISEGRDASTIAGVRSALEVDGTSVLNVHSDPDHHRSVYTVAGPPQALADAMLACARTAIEHIDVMSRASSEHRRSPDSIRTSARSMSLPSFISIRPRAGPHAQRRS